MTEDDLPAGYNLSRAAQRKRYGARSIDGSAPLSARSSINFGERLASSDATGFTPDESWRKFFRKTGVGMGFTATTPNAAFADPKTAMKGDPSKGFQMAGAPPIGGPVTAPMPTTPTAMQYYQEGIKGAQPFVPGAVTSGDRLTTPYGTASVRSADDVLSESLGSSDRFRRNLEPSLNDFSKPDTKMLDFLKRYRL